MVNKTGSLTIKLTSSLLAKIMLAEVLENIQHTTENTFSQGTHNRKKKKRKK